jgi:hypothetical protein
LVAEANQVKSRGGAKGKEKEAEDEGGDSSNDSDSDPDDPDDDSDSYVDSDSDLPDPSSLHKALARIKPSRVRRITSEHSDTDDDDDDGEKEEEGIVGQKRKRSPHEVAESSKRGKSSSGLARDVDGKKSKEAGGTKGKSNSGSAKGVGDNGKKSKEAEGMKGKSNSGLAKEVGNDKGERMKPRNEKKRAFSEYAEEEEEDGLAFKRTKAQEDETAAVIATPAWLYFSQRPGVKRLVEDRLDTAIKSFFKWKETDDYRTWKESR